MQICNTDRNSPRKSKGLSDESIKSPATSDNSLASALNYVGNKAGVNCDGSCLKQDKITFAHGSTVDIYIAYEISSWPFRRAEFKLGNALLGDVQLVKSMDKSKYKYQV